ncbi:unnamed protein product [[Actinomadura] parvosata subsp. kistnae]|uniref:DUF421 domain-containing protein n=2 Tax=Nonomuraea TaxID=83681 RepID=A0A1V0AGH7_9ACTN|nr:MULTISPECIES: YetF domain-containing protein [unclassified Nonomuraea]AQZ69305.1 DUF421 domain-containing protein [Nonomuraea sp. ATCC 55076]NJP90577.1 DUF421 domain-containing protein [Nonomuraea sp. FMUSA5-5]SPL92064.1 unnamed protein product [Actinomadura parvosata subsp. kistnae]
MIDDLFHTGVSLADKAIRTVAVYVTVAALLRLGGKRGIAQLNNFDFVVMLLMSNVVQNAIIGPDNSLAGGLAGLVILMAVNAVVVRLAATVPAIGRLVEGSPTVLARDGGYVRSALRRLGVRQADLDVAIQLRGGTSVADTSLVRLEPGGAVLVRLRPDEENAERGDVAELRTRLDRIERKLDALAGTGGST